MYEENALQLLDKSMINIYFDFLFFSLKIIFPFIIHKRRKISIFIKNYRI